MPYSHGPLRILETSGVPGDRGRVHGSTYAEEIRAYARDRARLAVAGTSLAPADAVALAGACLEAHASFSPALMEETEGIAAGAGVSPAEALLVSGYTDILDVVRAHAGGAPQEDNCTAALVPDTASVDGAFLAQTWDMHASATPHVVMLRTRETDQPTSLVFTTVGCIGQIGMNDAGIAIGINNLTAGDGRVGVTWPFVVRKVLAQSDLEAAVDVVTEAPLAGGHNFLLMDGNGAGCNVEAMPTERTVTPLVDVPLVHTNHCVADSTRAVEAFRDPALASSSDQRLAEAHMLLADRPIAIEDVFAFTADERSICRHPDPVYRYETCGAAVMRPATGDFWACWGRPSESDYEHLRVISTDG